jgi:hypothetical protein
MRHVGVRTPLREGQGGHGIETGERRKVCFLVLIDAGLCRQQGDTEKETEKGLQGSHAYPVYCGAVWTDAHSPGALSFTRRALRDEGFLLACRYLHRLHSSHGLGRKWRKSPAKSPT